MARGERIKRHTADVKFFSSWIACRPEAYLCKGRSCWWECLRLRAQRVRVLLLRVTRWQDFRSRNIRTGSAAGGGVSVRVVTLRLHQRRRRSHCGAGSRRRRRRVAPHGVLIHGTGERRRRRVHVGGWGRRRSHADSTGDWNGAGHGWSCRQGRRLADGWEGVGGGRRAGEVVESRRGRSIARDLTEKAVLFSDICGIIWRNGNDLISFDA